MGLLHRHDRRHRGTRLVDRVRPVVRTRPCCMSIRTPLRWRPCARGTPSGPDAAEAIRPCREESRHLSLLCAITHHNNTYFQIDFPGIERASRWQRSSGDERPGLGTCHRFVLGPRFVRGDLDDRGAGWRESEARRSGERWNSSAPPRPRPARARRCPGALHAPS